MPSHIHKLNKDDDIVDNLPGFPFVGKCLRLKIRWVFQRTSLCFKSPRRQLIRGPHAMFTGIGYRRGYRRGLGTGYMDR